MKEKTDIIIANPAGNTTIMVLSHVPREKYGETANKLLSIDFGQYCGWAEHVYGEQVCYIIDGDPDGNPEMEMCGLEFCGNASRSFGFFLAKVARNRSSFNIKVSGCDHLLKARADTCSNTASVEIPVPKKAFTIILPQKITSTSSEKNGTMVVFDGIAHLILEDCDATSETFENIRDYIYDNIDSNMEAFGVMFLSQDRTHISPVVYVRDVDTTYFEGSCASGTAATAYALSLALEDGVYDYSFAQPEGVLEATVNKSKGNITEITLGGHVELSSPITLEI